jgi:carboxypeptidase C (cathepsin A)
LRERLTVRNYEGGHMFYSHAVSRAAFYEDARRLYEKIAGGKP